MVIAEQLFCIYVSLFSECRQQALRGGVQCRALNFWCVCARADFSLSIIRIVTFVQVKLLLLFANTVSLRAKISTNTQYNSFSSSETRQSRAERYLASTYGENLCECAVHACGYVDLMELILIWRTDWKEVNQLISHNNSVRALVHIDTHTIFRKWLVGI